MCSECQAPAEWHTYAPGLFTAIVRSHSSALQAIAFLRARRDDVG